MCHVFGPGLAQKDHRNACDQAAQGVFNIFFAPVFKGRIEGAELLPGGAAEGKVVASRQGVGGVCQSGVEKEFCFAAWEEAKIQPIDLDIWKPKRSSFDTLAAADIAPKCGVWMCVEGFGIMGQRVGI